MKIVFDKCFSFLDIKYQHADSSYEFTLNEEDLRYIRGIFAYYRMNITETMAKFLHSFKKERNYVHHESFYREGEADPYKIFFCTFAPEDAIFLLEI